MLHRVEWKPEEGQLEAEAGNSAVDMVQLWPGREELVEDTAEESHPVAAGIGLFQDRSPVAKHMGH